MCIHHIISYHISYIIYHISYIIYHISYIIYHISYIIYHISYIIYHISYIISPLFSNAGPHHHPSHCRPESTYQLAVDGSTSVYHPPVLTIDRWYKLTIPSQGWGKHGIVLTTSMCTRFIYNLPEMILGLSDDIWWWPAGCPRSSSQDIRPQSCCEIGPERRTFFPNLQYPMVLLMGCRLGE